MGAVTAELATRRPAQPGVEDDVAVREAEEADVMRQSLAPTLVDAR